MTTHAVASHKRKAVAFLNRNVRPRPFPRSRAARVAARAPAAHSRKKLDQGQHEDRGGSWSMFNHGKRPHKLPAILASKMTPLVYTKNASFFVTNTAGKQLVTDVNVLFDTGTNAVCNTIASQALVQQYGAATPLGYRTDRILLKSVSSTLQFTNATNATMFVDLYDVIARRDIFPYNDIVASTVTLTPSLAWAEGQANEVAGGGTTGNQYVGAKPFDSQLFCKFYRVQKITHVILAIGQTHVHRVQFSPNYVLDCQLLNQTNVAALGGLTCTTMMVARGQPVKDVTNAAVTTAATELMMVVGQEYEFSYIPNNSKTLVLNTTVLATASSATSALYDPIDALKEAVGIL